MKKIVVAGLMMLCLVSYSQADIFVVGDSGNNVHAPWTMLNGVTNEWGWSSARTELTPWATFDLTTVAGLNEHNFGGDNSVLHADSLTLYANADGGYGLAGAINLFYSADLTTFDTANFTLLGSYEVSIVNAVPTVIDMGGVLAQYVKIVITAAGGSHGVLGDMEYEGPGFAEAVFVTSPVPEPATMSLLGLGLVGLLTRRKK